MYDQQLILDLRLASQPASLENRWNGTFRYLSSIYFFADESNKVQRDIFCLPKRFLFLFNRLLNEPYTGLRSLVLSCLTLFDFSVPCLV